MKKTDWKSEGFSDSFNEHADALRFRASRHALPQTLSQEMTQFPTARERMSYDDVTIVFERLTDGNLERGFVPGYHFKILNEQSDEVGHLNFRVGDAEHVRFAAGHIGFEIVEQYRGHGYAGSACLAVAPWVSEVAGTVLITVDPDNLPSIRTIERIGGDFLDEVDVPEGDPHYLRGSFRKRRYRWKPSKANKAHEGDA